MSDTDEPVRYHYDPSSGPKLEDIIEQSNFAFPGVTRGYIVVREHGEVTQVATGAMLVDPDGFVQFLSDDGAVVTGIVPPPDD